LKLPEVVIVPPVATIKDGPPAVKPNPFAEPAPRVDCKGILSSP
jgi:hypothetical protein